MLKKTKLSESDRKIIIDDVCHFWLNNKYTPDKQDYQEIASQIVNQFPNENKVRTAIA